MWSSLAWASLVGTQISVTPISGKLNTTDSSPTVGTGIEFTFGIGSSIGTEFVHDVDVGNDGISFTASPLAGSGASYMPFSIAVLGGFDWGGTGSLQSVALVIDTLAGGSTPIPSGFSPGHTDFTLELSGVQEAALFSIEWTTSHDATAPEPSPIALLGIGLVVFARRRHVTATAGNEAAPGA